MTKNTSAAKSERIFLAGSSGMVGSSIARQLAAAGYENLLLPGSDVVDLIDQKRTAEFFARERPGVVVLAAARVGGIGANSTQRAQFIYENLMIEANVIHAASQNGVRKLIFLGSSCIYPRMAPQPMKEEYLLSGPLEITNEPYAVAKIAGIKLCESYYHQYGCNFFAVMPTNLFGPNDNFDLESSHVVPALIRKFHEAKVRGESTVRLWGSGKPRREFMYVDDVAEAIVFLLENHNAADFYENGISHINVGTGNDIEISELAQQIGELTQFEGKVEFDPTRPDGTPRKLLDVTRIEAMGWRSSTTLVDGLRKTYDWFLGSAIAQVR